MTLPNILKARMSLKNMYFHINSKKQSAQQQTALDWQARAIIGILPLSYSAHSRSLVPGPASELNVILSLAAGKACNNTKL
jgi:hypothetical protein